MYAHTKKKRRGGEMVEKKTQTEPLTVRVATEMKAEFIETAKQQGLTQEAFMSVVMSAYREQEEQDSTSVVISQEKKQVRSGLNQVKTLVEAVIDRAIDQELQSKQFVTQSTEKHSTEIAEFNTQIKNLNDTLAKLEDENTRLTEDQENRDALKQAFREQKESWENQRKDFDNKIIDLTKSAADLSKENIKFRNTIDDLKEKIQKNKEQYDKAVVDHRLNIKDLEIDYQNKLYSLEIKLNKNHEEKVKSVIEQEKENANDRVAEMQDRLAGVQEQLNFASQENKQLQIDSEEKIKAAVELERAAADQRFNDLMKVFSKPEKNIEPKPKKVTGKS